MKDLKPFCLKKKSGEKTLLKKVESTIDKNHSTEVVMVFILVCSAMIGLWVVFGDRIV